MESVNEHRLIYSRKILLLTQQITLHVPLLAGEGVGSAGAVVGTNVIVEG